MHPNKIVLTKEVDEDVGDQFYPTGCQPEGATIVGCYIRANRAYKKELEICREPGYPPSLIWLQPTCRECIQHGRMWCEFDEWDFCEQCGHKSIPYIRDIDEEEKLK